MSEEAQKIAASLTPAQRKALARLPASGRQTAALDVPSKRVLGRLPELASGVGRTGLPGTYAYNLTPCGIAVRAVLVKSEPPHA